MEKNSANQYLLVLCSRPVPCAVLNPVPSNLTCRLSCCLKLDSKLDGVPMGLGLCSMSCVKDQWLGNMSANHWSLPRPNFPHTPQRVQPWKQATLGCHSWNISMSKTSDLHMWKVKTPNYLFVFLSLDLDLCLKFTKMANTNLRCNSILFALFF